MSEKTNTEVVLRFIQAVNDWDWDAVGEVIDPANYVENNPAWGAIGFEQMRQTYEMVRASCRTSPSPRTWT